MTHLTIHRAQEAELPATVNLQFINKNADYQPGTQQARRLTVNSDQKVDLQLAIVMTDKFARNLVESILYTAWIERNSFGVKVPRKYCYLEATDSVYLTDAESHLTYRARITKVGESRNDGIEWECISDFTPVYHQNIGAQEVVIVTPVPIPVSRTTAMVLGLPQLSMSDSSTGFYIAMGGETSSWRGAALYQSNDEGVTYNQIGSFTTAATIGKTVNALGDWKGGDTFDELNTLKVTTNLALVSLPELSILNGANVAAVSSYGGGWEIIQFKNAVLQSDGSYLLSGLLRGQKGTEWAMNGHSAGDNFVLLDSSLKAVSVNPSKIGIPMLYKVVAPGQPISAAPAYTIAATATAFKPFSPALAGGGKMADGGILITWIRRDRIDAEWVDGRDILMNESAESYEIDIYDTNFASVKRTIAVGTTQNFNYALDEQIADFGSEQNELFFAIYQISSLVGRGYPAWGHLSPEGVDAAVAYPTPSPIPVPLPA